MSEVNLQDAIAEIQKSARAYKAFEFAEKIIEVLAVADQTKRELAGKIAEAEKELAKQQGKVKEAQAVQAKALADAAAATEDAEKRGKELKDKAVEAAKKIVDEAAKEAGKIVEAAKIKAEVEAKAKADEILRGHKTSIDEHEKKLATVKATLAELKGKL